MPDAMDDTLQRLWRLDQGWFQRVGNLVLPQLHVDLADWVLHASADSHHGRPVRQKELATNFPRPPHASE